MLLMQEFGVRILALLLVTGLEITSSDVVVGLSTHRDSGGKPAVVQSCSCNYISQSLKCVFSDEKVFGVGFGNLSSHWVRDV